MNNLAVIYQDITPAIRACNLKKIYYATPEGQEHIAKAQEQGVTAPTIYTDGKIYAIAPEKLTEAQSEPQTAIKKTTKKAQKD